MHFITDLFNNYGYIVLFVALMLELIAFPTPGESLMTYCGFLVFQGKLNWGLSVIVATMGVIAGITISYFISRTLGTPFFQKYGSYIHLGPDKLEKTSQWFERYGNGLLVIAYFIPGVRHITGYFSGIAKIPYKKFALNAYIGAFIWTGTFISLGKILGSNWEKFHGAIKKYLIIGGIILAIVLLCIYFYRKYKELIIDIVMESLENGIQIFHSLGKMKVAIVGIAAIFIGLSIVLIGLIQDFLAHEFSQFDTIVTYLVSLIFPENWSYVMELFKFPTAPEVLLALTLLILTWIILKGRNRLLETGFLFITVFGGALLEEGLRLIFHRVGPSGFISTFPSRETLLAVVVYGFASFMVLRHSKNRWIGTLLFIMTLGVCIVTGLTDIFFQVQYPSDTVAGYVFGGVWLSLNIVLMEVYRALSEVNSFN
ncbi:Alkaline phosphatase like protein [Desulfosporosinus sp. I2]|uniref:VTT domain-containing protein n=1 Tax=Desulfosporosinus sp. I2 TaxID=1617025 RepID=UPI0005EDD903|nr:VTT domain-containing protein [Desulfosporosinus sp. I2]KJR48858.1 Alkaline phosphatase like protein [Desulfosporosinus sp. I2]